MQASRAVRQHYYFSYQVLKERDDVAIKLKNDLMEIGRLATEVEEYGETNGFPMKTIFDINLTLEELVTNIISYGYNDEEEHLIEVRFKIQDNELIIEVEDDGIPFNPLEMPEPDTEKALEEREIGGLGIHLVKNLMDDVQYCRKMDRNILTIKKRIMPE